MNSTIDASDAELSSWLRELPDQMPGRLVAVGLATARTAETTPTLGGLLDRFESNATVKPSTRAAYRQTSGSILKHFGAEADARTLTPAGADAWRKSIAVSGLAPATGVAEPRKLGAALVAAAPGVTSCR